MGQEQLELQSSFQQLFFMGSEPGFPPRIKLKPFQVRIPLYSITDWHRSPISDSHPFDQPG
ncbi:hypothetical protein QU763_24895, partial [Escherichia coli]|nr:hypothetical protein [Escherichia coli]